jgi:hypothetical protein
MDQLVTGVPGYVTADQFAVHTHLLAAHMELQYLVPGDLELAFFKQVFTVLPGIFNQVASEQVLGGGYRFGIFKRHQS